MIGKRLLRDVVTRLETQLLQVIDDLRGKPNNQRARAFCATRTAWRGKGGGREGRFESHA
jgi:hypothetical protein